LRLTSHSFIATLQHTLFHLLPARVLRSLVNLVPISELDPLFALRFLNKP
jgi:hypothetical protein